MGNEKPNVVERLKAIHDSLEEKSPDTKKQLRKLINELDSYEAFFGEPECDTGERLPEP